MELNDLKEKLKKALDGIKDAVMDLSSLDVTTVTGEVSQIITDKEINLPQAINSLSSGDPEVKIELVAHTHIEFDQDASMFIKKNFTGNDEKLFELHQITVKSALEARQAFLKFIQEVIKP